MTEQKKRSILLIEDNKDHAEITQFHITDHAPDIDVVWLNDGELAINHIVEKHALSDGTYPWLVLLDIKLPKYSGHEVLARLKSDERLKKIPVVMFTTSNVTKDIESALMQGANSYIQKPMELGEFGSVIAKIIDYWSLDQHRVMIERGNNSE